MTERSDTSTAQRSEISTARRGKALFVVHDTDTDRGIADTGTLRGHVADRGYEVQIVHPSGELPDVSGFDFAVVMGSSESAYDDSVPWLAAELTYLRAALAANVPIFGVCFGGQLLSRVLGGTVKRSDHPEHGYVTVNSVAPELVSNGPWMQMHFDRFSLPPGAREIARNGAALQAFTFGRNLAVQFHPEISPAVWATWQASWAVSREGQLVVERGIDLQKITAEITARAEESHRNCGILLDAFLKLVHAPV
ncbi:type 1 glutamine amidotransferase [Williamsia sp. 1135]|uniref:type 1 glutamine amidotransferase n=1 Tax=Williamsia sp. 1135 TaxID=1889262 RepID=UPI001438CD31|nr:type 1 glutamine amidotransferase [Williamsia sp. 1135]